MLWLFPWSILWSLSWFSRDVQVASLATPSGPVIPQIVSVDLTVSNRCVAPDGFPRVAILVGRQGEEPTLPGPIISGYKGDRFLINVTDALIDTSMLTGTTIHWHGISQYHSNQMDGTAYVTQCPIYPGNSFLYNFTVYDQAGTFWYHSHYQVQYCDGLRGALIVRDHDDPYQNWYDFDDDSTVISLADWYHFPSVTEPQKAWSDSILINGTGCYDGMECALPAIYKVQARKRYRFRLLNMSCEQFYNFTIDNHAMTIIEVDGAYVEPYVVDSIQIYAAQRYSFILNADQPVDNYWIRAIPNPKQPMNATHTAILRYFDAPDVKPETVNTAKSFLNETHLRSFKEPPSRLLDPNPDFRVNIVMGKNSTTHDFLVNGVQYKSPSAPVLMQIMNGALSWEVDPVQSVYFLPRNKVIEFTFHVDGTGGRPHPFHLHGHHFAVIKSADSQYRNYDRPVMRDTVSTGATDAEDGVTVRFITDNPGPWLLHCHIEWHLWAGLAIVFVEGYDDIWADQPFSNASRALCPYHNPYETFRLPPPRSTAGPYHPSTTLFCTLPTPPAKNT